MKIHILGISGTFMSGLAIIAKELGMDVTGCDTDCYPPVSDLLRSKDISWFEGYEINEAFLQADLIIVGNAMKRGLPIVEAMLNQKKEYQSGPQWLFEYVLKHKRVIAVSGTHGKTTTTSMIAHILEQSGKKPGFLIGGVAPNFGTNARLGEGEWFVIEADEYDSAFFDKRPKFMHYHPEIAILNNLEFDHADIYADLSAIEQQFAYYLKTIPSFGQVIVPKDDVALKRVIEKECYSQLHKTTLIGEADWAVIFTDEKNGKFSILHQQEPVANIVWPLLGRFNVENGLHAFIASQFAGVEPLAAACALQSFHPVKRRLELKACVNGIAVFDDFAHHPTAIEKTVQALKESSRYQRIIVALEFASYTMKTGIHFAAMPGALANADLVVMLASEHFDTQALAESCRGSVRVVSSTQDMIDFISHSAREDDAILVMSNRGFENLHQRLIETLSV